MATFNTPKRATAHKFYVGLADQANTKLLKANPTIAAGDFQVSKDGGAFANLTTLPSANPAAGRAVMIDLSATEMTADSIVVQCVDAAGAEWCDLMIAISTTARQLDDLATPTNITAATGVVLSGVTHTGAVIPTVTTLTGHTAQTGDSFARIGAAGAGLTNIGTIATVTNLTNLPAITANWLTAAGIAAGALDGKGNWNIGKTGYALTATTGLGNQTADITGSLSGSVGSVTGAVGSVTGAVGSVTGAVGSVTGAVGSVAAGGITASSIAADAIGASELAADAVTEIVTALLTTQMTEAYRADAAAPTLAQAICEVLAHLGEAAIAGTTKTIKKFDGTTTAETFTLNDATTPTSITRAT